MSGNSEHNPFHYPTRRTMKSAMVWLLNWPAKNYPDLKDLEEQCRKSDSTCRIDNSSRIIILKYLNRTYQVTLPDITYSLQNSDEKVELRDKILILHYLTRAKGTPLSNSLIAYQELQEGATYLSYFHQKSCQTLDRLLRSNSGKIIRGFRRIRRL